jgi:hypothetical protein
LCGTSETPPVSICKLIERNPHCPTVRSVFASPIFGRPVMFSVNGEA